GGRGDGFVGAGQHRLRGVPRSPTIELLRLRPVVALGQSRTSLDEHAVVCIARRPSGVQFSENMASTRVSERRRRVATGNFTSRVARSASRRTSLNLPPDLVRRAQAALGTKSVTATVIQALEEAVNLRLRLRLLHRELPDLTPQLVKALRQPEDLSGRS